MKFTVTKVGKKKMAVRNEYTADTQVRDSWVVEMVAIGIEGRALNYILENEQESQRYSVGQTRDVDI